MANRPSNPNEGDTYTSDLGEDFIFTNGAWSIVDKDTWRDTYPTPGAYTPNNGVLEIPLSQSVQGGVANPQGSLILNIGSSGGGSGSFGGAHFKQVKLPADTLDQTITVDLTEDVFRQHLESTNDAHGIIEIFYKAGSDATRSGYLKYYYHYETAFSGAGNTPQIFLTLLQEHHENTSTVRHPTITAGNPVVGAFDLVLSPGTSDGTNKIPNEWSVRFS